MTDGPKSSGPQRDGRLAPRWVFATAMAVLAFVLGYVGFRQRFALLGEARSPLDCAYLSLQLFVLESGSATPPIPPELEIARALAPAVAVFGAIIATLALLGERFAHLRLRFAKGHAVVCGLGDTGLHIAENLLLAGWRVAVVDAEPDGVSARRVRGLGGVLITDDARDARTLRRVRAQRARYVIAAHEDEGANAEIVVHLAELLADFPGGDPVTVTVLVRDAQLGRLLREHHLLAADSARLRLDFFSLPERGASAMLRAVPPPNGRDGAPARVVVAGMNDLGYGLVLQLLQGWWAMPFSRSTPATTLVIVDDDAAAKVEAVRASCGHLASTCRFEPVDLPRDTYEIDPRGLLGDPTGRVDAVYVCVPDEVHSMALALALHRQTRTAGVPIAVRMNTRRGLATLLAGEADPDLVAVAVLDEACDLDSVLGGVNEVIARAIHEDYVRRERSAGHSGEDNPATVRWEMLTEDLRESNRRQADALGDKLRAARMAIVPLTDSPAAICAFTDAEIESLGQMEHERWVTERTAQGWRYSPGTKDLARKTSPHMVPWAELTQDVRDLDRDTVRAIPSFLARAGYALVRE